MRTWQKEAAVVGVVLAMVAFFSGKGWVEWIGALAVFMTFMHGQVSIRFTEAAKVAERDIEKAFPEDDHKVECWKWSDRYYWTKEGLWFAYFLLHQSWSALVGCILFLAYPMWRKWWVRRA